MFGNEEQSTTLRKLAVERTGPLDEATMFVESLIKRLTNLRQQLTIHSDRVFGERETVSGSDTSPVPIPSASGGKLIQLSQVLVQLDSNLSELEVEVHRSCQL